MTQQPEISDITDRAVELWKSNGEQCLTLPVAVLRQNAEFALQSFLLHPSAIAAGQVVFLVVVIYCKEWHIPAAVSRPNLAASMTRWLKQCVGVPQ